MAKPSIPYRSPREVADEILDERVRNDSLLRGSLKVAVIQAIIERDMYWRQHLVERAKVSQ